MGRWAEGVGRVGFVDAVVFVGFGLLLWVVSVRLVVRVFVGLGDGSRVLFSTRGGVVGSVVGAAGVGVAEGVGVLSSITWAAWTR